MVRIIQIDSRIRSARAVSARTWTAANWECGDFARLLEREGYVLQARNCGDGTWVVAAEHPEFSASIVATGLEDSAAADEWIQRERLVTPELYQFFARTVRKTAGLLD